MAKLTYQQRQRHNELRRTSRLKRSLKYLADVEERNRHKATLKQYGRDNQGIYNRRGMLRFRNLPPHMRPIAEQELSRLIDKAKRDGKRITQQKYGSLCANAAFITRYIRCSNLQLKWRKRYFNTRLAIERWRAKEASSHQTSVATKLQSGQPRTNDPTSLLTGI